MRHTSRKTIVNAKQCTLLNQHIKPTHCRRYRGVNATPRIGTIKQHVLAVALTIVCALCFISTSAAATNGPQQTRTYHLDLPEQTVATALNSLSEQTDIQVLFPYDIAAQLRSEPLLGRFSIELALERLLRDTGLHGGLTSSGVITISQTGSESTTNQNGKGKRMNIKNSTKRKTLLAGLVGLFAAGGMTQAVAQGGESATSQSAIDEIIVTAQKREQSLQDTALAITAITGEGLAARGIESGIDLQFSVPGLTIGESSVGPAQVTIRGVGMEQVFLGGDPGVPIHIDGHYVQDTTYILQDFLDVERVEVLRGPQGTLYGRNAIGGNINIVTKRPTEEFEAEIGIDVGNYDKRLAQGVVSGSLADGLRGRFTISDEKRDGYIENISQLGGQDFKNSDYTSVRGLVEYDLADDVLVTFGGYYFENFGNTAVGRFVSEYPTDMLPGFVNYYALNNAGSNPTLIDPRKISSNVSDDVFSRARGGSVDVEWDLGEMTFRSLSSYNNSKSLLFIEGDGSDVVALHDEVRRTHETFSQEFQLLSDIDSELTWIFGLFYYDERSGGSEIFDWDNFFVADGSKSVLDIFYDFDSTALGVFGQIEHTITDKLTIVGGLRYNKDEKSYLGELFIPDFALTIISDEDDQWDKITGKIGLNYHIDDDVMLYASYSTGYKSGGFNLQPSYEPETVETLETGAKGLFFDNKVQFSLNWFYSDYSDKQDFKRDPTIGLAQITNAASATVWGLELEGVARPLPGLMIDASIAFLNAEYDEFATQDNINPQLGTQDLSGNKLPRSPEWKFYLGLQYEWILNTGRLAARVDAVWVDEQFSANFNRRDRDLIDSYHRTNAQLTWESNNDLWLASLYVQNIEDDDVVANLFDGGELGGLPVSISGQFFAPRTYGLKLTRQF